MSAGIVGQHDSRHGSIMIARDVVHFCFEAPPDTAD
jgi:hypothetical protein